jgi:hypothetical protein
LFYAGRQPQPAAWKIVIGVNDPNWFLLESIIVLEREPETAGDSTALRILNKVGVPTVTEGLPFSFSTPTVNQVLERLRWDLGILGVLF